MYQDLHFYIDLNWQRYVDEGKEYLKKIYKIVNLAYQHQAIVYYNKTQIKEFSDNCSDLDEGFSQSNGQLLELILKNAKTIKEIGFAFEVCYEKEHTSLKHLENTILASLVPNTKGSLLSLSDDKGTKTVLIIKSNSEFYKCEIEICNDHISIMSWIVENTRERVFNTIPKHGSDKKKAWDSNKGDDVSRLLCSSERAQEFLNLAITDLNKYKNRLYYFDKENKTYLEFRCEGDIPQNQWHGFHLNKSEILKSVPSSVIDYFDKLAVEEIA